MSYPTRRPAMIRLVDRLIARSTAADCTQIVRWRLERIRDLLRAGDMFGTERESWDVRSFTSGCEIECTDETRAAAYERISHDVVCLAVAARAERYRREDWASKQPRTGTEG